jgi:hypothetical protein
MSTRSARARRLTSVVVFALMTLAVVGLGFAAVAMHS